HDITTGTVAGSLTLPGRKVSQVVVHPTDPNTVFLAFMGYSYATSGSKLHIYRGNSADGGATWRWDDISGNLPDVPVGALAINNAVTTIWAGTDVGVFSSIDGGTTWAPYGMGLPSVVIADLHLNGAG